MKRFGLAGSAVVVLLFVVGCATGSYTTSPVYQQEAGNDYCHKKMKPIGSSEAARQPQGIGDYIDYYGPCDGPSVTQQIQDQKRFEQFRFGREYMDEG
jgi:hypothetical protein